jgi:uridylate kinase
MKKQVIVLSLGGSLIIPDDVNLKFLEKFKKVILKHTKKYKFLIVCGGGSIARKYITALKKAGLNEEFQSFAGISATRMNARFMNYFFGINPEQGIPHTSKTMEEYESKRDVVFFGALEYKPKQTSDATAAEAARHFRTIFINLTNVPGLYNKNPLENKDAKFIPRISWKEFDKLANSMNYKPGQHFVLDQTASKIIMKHKIPTYILGSDLNQLEAVLNKKRFKGSLISG